MGRADVSDADRPGGDAGSGTRDRVCTDVAMQNWNQIMYVLRSVGLWQWGIILAILVTGFVLGRLNIEAKHWVVVVLALALGFVARMIAAY